MKPKLRLTIDKSVTDRDFNSYIDSATTLRSPERGSKTVMHLQEPMRKRDEDIMKNHHQTKLRFIKNFNRKTSV